MDQILDDMNIRYERDVMLGPLTWYGVGGPAKILAYPSSVQQLSSLASRAHEHSVPVYVLGSGANLLVSEEGVNGLVVRLNDPAFQQISTEDNVVHVGPGFDLMKLVLASARARAYAPSTEIRPPRSSSSLSCFIPPSASAIMRHASRSLSLMHADSRAAWTMRRTPT